MFKKSKKQQPKEDPRATVAVAVLVSEGYSPQEARELLNLPEPK